MSAPDAFPPLPVCDATSPVVPVVIVDSREQTPLEFHRLPSRVGTLTQGDYSVAGLESDFAVERKSIPDLLGSLTSGRERFMREIDRLRGCGFCRLLVVGLEDDISSGRYRSNANPKAIMHSLYAIESRGLPVVFSPSPYEAAALIERWAWWRSRAVLQAGNRFLEESVRGSKGLEGSVSQQKVLEGKKT